MNRNPNPKTVHFVGIGGSGMSGLAELAAARGMIVQGSDAAHSAPVERLARLGIKVFSGHGAHHLDGACTVVYSSAIPADNTELQTAREMKLSLLHRSEFLASLMVDTSAVTVAGTHGKTTTTAMIGHVLEDLGVDPSIAVGGIMCRHSSSVRNGKGRFFVAEADESDGSFLKYKPLIGVLTNVDQDHMEFFGTTDKLLETFRAYLNSVVRDGIAVVGWDSPLGRQVAEGYTGQRLTFGFILGSEVRGIGYSVDNGGCGFTAIVERDKLTCRLRQTGKHNVLNALCTLAVCRALELDVKHAAESLAEFKGVERRMSLLFDHQDVRIFDDYAHNPGKIAASIEALREAWPKHQLIVVYQPHRFSRLETLYESLLASFHLASSVVVLPVYAAGEKSRSEFSPSDLARDIERLSKTQALPAQDFSSAAKTITAMLKAPAIVLTLGAGDVYRMADYLKELRP